MSARQTILNQVMRFADPADMDAGNWDICTDNILAALDKAGYAPPLLKGVIHKALQDAFQAGGIEAVETLQKPGKFLSGKHRYCDKELDRLTAAKETS